MRDVEPGDLIWIHDFYLMLLLAMLMEKPGRDFKVKIVFYLYTPFRGSTLTNPY